MPYIEKEKALLAAMKERGYQAVFDGSRDDALDTVEEQMGKFTGYVNVVIREQVMGPIWRDRCEPEDLRERIMAIDRERRIAHNAAIDAVNILNRLSKAYGVAPFADIDTDDRHAVADMVGDYVAEVYSRGTGKDARGGMDGATYGRNEEYDRKKIRERMEMIEDELSGIAGGGAGMEMG